VTLIAVIGALSVIQPVATAVAVLGFGFIYAIIVIVTKHQVARNSRTIAYYQGRVTKALQEGLGGIRDVLIDGTQSVYIKLYKEARRPMQSAVAGNQVMATFPRFGVEALGISLIAGMAYMLASADGISDEVAHTIPVLGALALGAQRILPLLQQIYSAYMTVKGYQASTEDALELLDQPIPASTLPSVSESIDFHTALTLKDLGFRYSTNGPWVFRNLNLKIAKGSRVGFVGATGSGKSTLADVIMGLLYPTEGTVFVDDVAVRQENTRAWQINISHVPQVVYLSDASIAENIAFGLPTKLVDMQRVKRVAEQAQIAKTIDSWRNGYKTIVGERGVRLSGGQRQRIGIARALYKRANVIIFDEATSALDNETEAAVMRSVEALGREITILIIAHRLTTLRSCDQIVELATGGINVVGCYEQVVRKMT
jgi:ATP-binding cassette subfamily B protein